MTYDEFLESLKSSSWHVPNRSFACLQLDSGWQVAFVRKGGRYQRPAEVAFVLCVRHRKMRNQNQAAPDFEREPLSYPYKFTLSEVEAGQLNYGGRLLNYGHSTLDAMQSWESVYDALTVSIPSWLSTLSREQFCNHVAERGQDGWIERMWLEDLQQESEPD